MKFEDWTPREIAALKRGTAKLRAMQPVKQKRTCKPTGLKGCHYNVRQGCYLIHVYVDGLRLYCGRMREFDMKQALKMQAQAERAYYENINKKHKNGE